MQAAQNAAQRVLDSVNYITETVTSISAKPTKLVSEWVADQIAPNYWIPNSRILHCALCNNEFGQFDQKHHCRLCGNGLCNTCSSKSKPVPERGWGATSVRVCDRCYERSDNLSAINSLPPLPPMLTQLQQHQGNNSASNANGFHAKTAHTNDNQTQLQQRKLGDRNNPSPTSSIPIPVSRATASGSSNTTLTPHSSSSIGSSSSDSNNHQLINEFSDHKSVLPPLQQNGSLDATKSGINNLIDRKQKTKDTAAESRLVVANSYTQQLPSNMNGAEVGSAITARKLGEVLQNTIKTVVSTAIDYPLGVIKDSARPEYWLPDSQISNCGLCRKDFYELVSIHHCRRCGGGFCHECSTKSMPVPERGWGDASVRVCDKCYELK